VEDAERIADKAHERDPGTRVLMVVSHVYPERQQGDGKFDAVTLPDPARLIMRTTELLEGLSDHELDEAGMGQQRRVRV
jgi:hypothetical protein